MIIIEEKDLPGANEIFMRHNTKPVYGILNVNGTRYVIFEKGKAAALLEVDMKYGKDYCNGRIIDR